MSTISRWLLIASAALIGLPTLLVALAIGVLWVIQAKPWYSDVVIRQITAAAGPYSAPWSRDAPGLFPNGMTRTAATIRLWRNGFSCLDHRTGDTVSLTQCERVVVGIGCNTTFKIDLAFGNETVVYETASKYSVCL